MTAGASFLAYMVIYMIHTNELFSAVNGLTSCSQIHDLSCGFITLPGGDAVAMVPKLLTNDDALMIGDIPQLQNVQQRMICSKPDCLSDPCRNGGTCLETVDGFSCDCTTDFHGATCACPAQYDSPDVGTSRVYTFVDPALTLAPGLTSFEWEVIADSDVHIGLSTVNGEQGVVYEIALGGWENTRSGVRRMGRSFVEHYGSLLIKSIWDKFRVSFDYNGHFVVYRVGDEADRIEWTDPEPYPIPVDAVIYIGFWTGSGSEGSWRFPLSLCSAET